jgi:hypothetical protein
MQLFRDLGGARTLDPLIKSQLLYQLSYEVISKYKIKIKYLFKTVFEAKFNF